MRRSLALASIGVETFPRERLHFGVGLRLRSREGAARCQLAALVCTATMTLYLHRAERADRLVIALGDLLSNPLPDAFATEIISVPTRGWSAGCPRASRSGLEPRLVAATEYASASPFLHRGGSWRGRWQGTRPPTTSIPGGRTASYGRCFGSLTVAAVRLGQRCCGITSAATVASPIRTRSEADAAGRQRGISPTSSPGTRRLDRP